MKELIAQQYMAQYGEIKVIMRFDGQIIYMKANNNPQKNQMVAQLRNNGASIEESSSGWLKIDMFKIHTNAKFGDKEIDVEELSKKEVEDSLCEFYKTKYEQAHFSVAVNQL